MSYESLSTLFHKDNSIDRYTNADAIAKLRIEAESTFRTGMDTLLGEFFLAVLREFSLLNEQVLSHARHITSRMRELPPVAQRTMIRGFIVDEVVGTNELEGVHGTRTQINELLQSDRSKKRPIGEIEVQGAVETLHRLDRPAAAEASQT